VPAYREDRRSRAAGLERHDRTLLRGFQSFGAYLPGVAMPLVKEKMQHETANVVLPAEEDLLCEHLQERRREGLRMNVNYLMRMRSRFRNWFDEIAVTNPPRADVDLDALSDQLTVIVEGAIIYAKALQDRALMGKQTRLFRSYIKLLFGA